MGFFVLLAAYIAYGSQLARAQTQAAAVSCNTAAAIPDPFPLYSKGVRLSLHVYITITFFPPPFLLLQHECLDKVLNAIQQDLLVNLF